MPQWQVELPGYVRSFGLVLWLRNRHLPKQIQKAPTRTVSARWCPNSMPSYT